MEENALYLITIFGELEQKDTERLVSAPSRAKAAQHAFGVNKASPADVARVLQAGGKIEQAA